jgi:hypothetical protein
MATIIACEEVVILLGFIISGCFAPDQFDVSIQ